MDGRTLDGDGIESWPGGRSIPFAFVDVDALIHRSDCYPKLDGIGVGGHYLDT